jgi:hypothetical protein
MDASQLRQDLRVLQDARRPPRQLRRCLGTWPGVLCSKLEILEPAVIGGQVFSIEDGVGEL